MNFNLENLSRFLIICLTYFLVGKLGLMLSLPSGYATLIFPPAGIAVATIYYWGRPAVYGVFIGSLILNTYIGIEAGGDLFSVIAIVIAVASLIQGLAGSRWLELLSRGDPDHISLVRRLVMRAPVFCLISGTVSVSYLFFEGVVPAEKFWENWIYWWIGDAMGVFIFFPIISILLDRQRQLSNKNLGIILGVSTLLFSLVVYVQVDTENKMRQEVVQKYQPFAESVWRKLDSMILMNREILSSMSRVINLYPDISYDKFSLMAEQILKEHSHLHALSWNMVVDNNKRQDFENVISSHPQLDGFKITERQDGKLVEANKRDQYVAVAYISPLETNKKALGFDIASNPKRLVAIKSAVSTGEMTATEPINLVQETSSQKGFLELRPVTAAHSFVGENNSLTNNVTGFVVGVIRSGEMIKQTLAAELDGKFITRVYDITENEKHELLFSSDLNEIELAGLHVDHSNEMWHQNIYFGGRTWHISIETLPTVIHGELTPEIIGLNILSLMVMGLAQLILFTLAGINHQVNMQVFRQTKELNALNFDLENRISRRTNELNAAKIKAETANAEKSRFLANISHELRTPMHAIHSFTHLTLKRELDDKARHFLQNIDKSTDRLMTLLNDLLDLSKLEAGKKELHLRQCSIKKLIEDVLHFLSALINQRHLIIETNDIAESTANIDVDLMTQVFTNLLSNAIKFSPQNGKIKLISHLQKDELFFSIEDEGVGVPADEFESIFDSFVQSTKTRSDSGGTGLGLPITKEIIELHGGEIWVESPPRDKENGSVFSFRIPVAQSL